MVDWLTRYRPLIAHTVSASGMFALFLCQVTVVPDKGMFGDKASLIDLWFVGHFVYGVILAGSWRLILREHQNKPWHASDWFVGVVACICLWEAFELPMELGYMGDRARVWMAGVEPPINRFVLDPLMGIIGALTCFRWPRIYLPLFAFGLLFEAAHIASPTAMSIQEWLLALFASS